MVDRRHIISGEDAGLSVAHSCPPVGIRLLRDLNDISTLKRQLTILLCFKVKQCLD